MTAGRPPNGPKDRLAAAITAREITNAEKAARDTKTARLQEARLAKGNRRGNQTSRKDYEEAALGSEVAHAEKRRDR